MASAFISETLRPSILQLDQLSDELFQEINSLNNELIYKDNENLMTIQKCFNDINKIVLKLKDEKSSKSVKLDQIINILQNFSNGSIMTSSDDNGNVENKLIVQLENLILLYSVILIYQFLLTNYLNSSLPLNEHYYYYDLIINSNWRILLYSLQTFPIRIFKLINNVTTEIKSTNLSNIESIETTNDYQAVSRYPIINKFYNNFKFYFKLVLKSFYNNVLTNNLKGFYKFSLNSFKFNNSIGLKSTSSNFINFKNYIKLVVGIPFNSIYEELVEKKSKIANKQLDSSKNLGYLILNIPNFNELINDSNKISLYLNDLINEITTTTNEPDQDIILSMKSSSSSPFVSLFNFTNHLNEIIPMNNNSISQFSKPSFLTRYWPSLLILILYGPKTIKSIVTNYDLILKFLNDKLWLTIKKFYENWILKPLNDIFNTIRHDSNSEISIMSQNSLNSELNSLKRMVIDYTIENESKNLSTEQISQLKLKLDELITNGDLTPFMENYENDIKTPLKTLVNGKLTRGLLIQLQKTKVDGSVAINGIDKLLKSQQLVFGIIAASPSLIIMIYLSNFLKSYWNNGFIVRGFNEKKLIVSKNLNNVERLMNKLISSNDDVNTVNGYLLIELFSLRSNGIGIIPRDRRNEWIRDINDIIKHDNSIEYKLNTINRIYHVYGKYL